MKYCLFWECLDVRIMSYMNCTDGPILQCFRLSCVSSLVLMARIDIHQVQYVHYQIVTHIRNVPLSNIFICTSTITHISTQQQIYCMLSHQQGTWITWNLQQMVYFLVALSVKNQPKPVVSKTIQKSSCGSL